MKNYQKSIATTITPPPRQLTENKAARGILGVCMALILSLVMGACGSSDDTDDTKPTTDKSDNTTKDKDGDKTFTVTFDLKGGTGTIPDQTIKKGDRAKVPTQPTRTEYRLTNWYTDEATTEVFAFTTPITADITLYAGWQSTIKTYTVTFDLNYTGATDTPPDAQTVKKGDKATEPTTVPTRPSFIFVGWYTEATATTLFNFTKTTITADITLYAKWSNNAVAITFDTGEGASTVPVKNVEKGSTTTKPADPTRDGYTFDNWYDAKTGGNVFAFTTTITEATTLYARWTPVYTVTFDSNDGTGTVPAQTIKKDGKATKPATPTKDGYVFKGWYIQQDGSGTAFAFDTSTITADTKLYAGWVYPYSITLGGTEYAGVADDATKTILVNIGTIYKKINGQTLQLVVTDNAGTAVATESVTLTDAKATIDVTRDGKTYTTLKLFVKPTTKDELKAIVTAAIDTTNGEGLTANLNFIDTSLMTDMSELFRDKTTFNGNLSEWDTSNVENMKGMFSEARAFNQAIGNWDTAKVTNMSVMFNDAQAFNQDIGKWKTGEVTDMSAIFYNAAAFNQDISTKEVDGTTRWDVSKVTKMNSMFDNDAGASAFNQNIGNWDVSNVKKMTYMFNGASAFNQDISQWNTTSVTNMAQMFNGARAFNQNISQWKTGEVTNMNKMFYNATEFDQNLSTWDVGKVAEHNEVFVGSAMATKTAQHPNWP